MLYYLSELSNLVGYFNLFKYVTFRAAGATFTAMFICFVFGPMTVRLLKKFNTMAPTRLEGIVEDKYIDHSKDKVPSMGGLLIVASITISTLLWARLDSLLILIFLGSLVLLCAIGFIDDLSKILKTGGMSAKMKLFCQTLVSVIAVGLLFYADKDSGGYLQKVSLPFLSKLISFKGAAVLVFGFAVFMMVGFSNAVNLTDGKDGLATGCTAISASTYALIAYLCGHVEFAEYLKIPQISGAGEVGIFCGAIAGACLGFLWYNCSPASMFMGDTGSLALGGSLAMVAIMTRQEVILIIIGGVFVIEAASVMLQVGYFKYTGGKRIFLCTPIHHHFERKGWTETQIVVRFWIIALICAAIGLATLKIR
ncbi:phospho-N-acetylmuramoyl-pentapeptide-transferase [Lentisphaerota bacterium WC36G]|nr:phospho-N-acetylmuramoyl-pentapeptide-transferase [Lentisphaerae bacterium WC36]